MSVVLVAPARPMAIGGGRLALWQPLHFIEPPSGGGSGNNVPPNAIAGLSGWWDASDTATAVGTTGSVVSGWNSATTNMTDKSGNGVTLNPYSFATVAGLPITTPRLSGLLVIVARCSLLIFCGS